MRIRIDLSKQLMAIFFKPYEVLGWGVVWNCPRPIGSGAVWKKISNLLPAGETISRASVIFFLNRQVDLKFMGWKDGTGKGGHHRRYYPLVSMTGLVRRIRDVAEAKFKDLFIMAEDVDAKAQESRTRGATHV